MRYELALQVDQCNTTFSQTSVARKHARGKAWSLSIKLITEINFVVVAVAVSITVAATVIITVTP